MNLTCCIDGWTALAAHGITSTDPTRIRTEAQADAVCELIDGSVPCKVRCVPN